MEAIGLLSTGWASGVNAYLTLLLLGIGGRVGWIDAPEALTSWLVLGVAGAMFAVEFVVDKIPYVDNVWDAVHTVIRPAIAAMAASATTGAELGEINAALGGAALALIAHGAKASTRLATNVSPEPFSNVGLSVAEDSAVAVLVGLAMAYPRVAAVIATIAVIASIIIAWLMWRLARRGWRTVRQRLAARAP